MSDTQTSRPSATDTQEGVGHGRHRGPGSTGDQQATPSSGRHRKPSDQQTSGQSA